MSDEPDDFVPPADSAVVAQLRQDVVSGAQVLIAPSRSGRPSTAARNRRPQLTVAASGARDECPFCWGNETATAEELGRTGPGSPGEPGWRVRVVRNRYPVVGGTEGATGECEVIVFRDHDRRIEDLGANEVAEILAVIRDRVAVQAAARTAVQVFVNAEYEAGASIAHPHAQIISLDFLPPAVELEFAMIRTLGRDPLQLDLDVADARGLVVVEGETPAWCPAASVLPYSVRIAPRTSTSDFVDLDADEIAALAGTLSQVLRAVNTLLDHPAYNIVIFNDQTSAGMHRRWRVEVVPRITVGGGFEIGTTVTTHATEATTAAEALRRELDRSSATAPSETALRAHS